MGNDLFRQTAAVIQLREEAREGAGGDILGSKSTVCFLKPENTSSENQHSQYTCHIVITNASLYGI
jgi:hypothetical protein